MFRKLPKMWSLFQFDVMLSSAGRLFFVVVVLQSFFNFLRIYSEEEVDVRFFSCKPTKNFAPNFPFLSITSGLFYYSPRSNHFFHS